MSETTPSEMLERVFAAARHGVEAVEASLTQPDDDWAPVLLIGAGNGDVIAVGLDPGFLNGRGEKDLLADIIIPGACMEFDAVALALVTSAWMVTQEGALDTSVAPSESPDRQETVIIMACTLEATHQGTAGIVRSRELPPMLEPWHEVQGSLLEVQGRMIRGMLGGLMEAENLRQASDVM